MFVHVIQFTEQIDSQAGEQEHVRLCAVQQVELFNSQHTISPHIPLIMAHICCSPPRGVNTDIQRFAGGQELGGMEINYESRHLEVTSFLNFSVRYKTRVHCTL